MTKPSTDLLTVKEITENLRIDEKSLYEYIKKGLPVQKINGRNHFSEKEVIQWRNGTHPKQKLKRVEKEAVSIRKETARAELLELDLMEKLQQVVLTDCVIEKVVDSVTRAKTKLLSIPVKFRSVLETHNVPLDKVDLIKDLLDEHIREALQELKEGKF